MKTESSPGKTHTCTRNTHTHNQVPLVVRLWHQHILYTCRPTLQLASHRDAFKHNKHTPPICISQTTTTACEKTPHNIIPHYKPCVDQWTHLYRTNILDRFLNLVGRDGRYGSQHAGAKKFRIARSVSGKRVNCKQRERGNPYLSSGNR